VYRIAATPEPEPSEAPSVTETGALVCQPPQPPVQEIVLEGALESAAIVTEAEAVRPALFVPVTVTELGSAGEPEYE